MEYKSKRLHQLLESLLSDSELRSWTVHNNKFGTSVTIRFGNDRPSLQQDPALQSTRETKSASDSEENEGASSTQLFKPASKYTINRDKQRMKDFVERRITRSQSRVNQCDSHMELPRGNADDLVAISPSHISPVPVLPDNEYESDPEYDNPSEAPTTLTPTKNEPSVSDASDEHDTCDSDGSPDESSMNITDSRFTWSHEQKIAIGRALGEALGKALKADMEAIEGKIIPNSTTPNDPDGSVT